MPRPPTVTKAEGRTIDAAVEHYIKNIDLFESLRGSLLSFIRNDSELKTCIHSLKSRLKEPSHLRDKLIRKALDAKSSGKRPDITASNLFERVNDLAGVRILHLHTDQLAVIDQRIRAICDEQLLQIIEGPTANCWDKEYEELFAALGISTKSRSSMYTSVHYIVQPSSRTRISAEIQVRTLVEEVWGEVSHAINYPHPTESVACAEQLKVLARVTSGCTRLVDSIFKTLEEHRAREGAGH